jgi:hypothetical protein
MHPFPRIRRIMAEQFYIKLVEHAGMAYDHQVLDLLLASPWDDVTTEETTVGLALQVAASLEVAHLMNVPQDYGS